MAAQRRIDLVLDSVRRLLRIGATANLLNLLQKQHPADLAQIFGELQDKEKQAAFSLLAERNGRLAMDEAIVNAIKVRIAELLVEGGRMPPVLTRASIVGESKSRALFDQAYQEHARRIARAIDTGGGGS